MQAKAKVVQVPELPDFCIPCSTGHEVEWLDRFGFQLSALIDKNMGRQDRLIDREVAAAIYFYEAVLQSPVLHQEWAALECWEGKYKAPKPSDRERLLEQVLRYFWSLLKNDQDGYELRLKVVSHVYQEHMSPLEVTSAIRKAGGYVSVRNSLRNADRGTTTNPREQVQKPQSSALGVRGTSHVQDQQVSGPNELTVRVVVSKRDFDALMSLADGESEVVRLVRRGLEPNGWKRLEATSVR